MKTKVKIAKKEIRLVNKENEFSSRAQASTKVGYAAIANFCEKITIFSNLLLLIILISFKINRTIQKTARIEKRKMGIKTDTCTSEGRSIDTNL